MEWTFAGDVIEWRGPAPYLFVAMTPQESEDIKEAARGLIYWGQVPVHVTIGDTEFTTALFPHGGRYLVPVKVAVQRAEGVVEGAIVEVVLRLNAAPGMTAGRRPTPSAAGNGCYAAATAAEHNHRGMVGVARPHGEPHQDRTAVIR